MLKESIFTYVAPPVMWTTPDPAKSITPIPRNDSGPLNALKKPPVIQIDRTTMG